jgi:PKD repeat protein
MNSAGKSTANQTITVTQNAPVASFDTDPTTGTAPLTVQFNDTSIGEITSWNWSYGDTSAWFNTTIPGERNVTHQYILPGEYKAQLVVMNSAGNSTANQTITVTQKSPVASFDTDPTTGTAPLTVQFNDTSIGEIISWNWSYGDTSAWFNTTIPGERNVTHPYILPGEYKAQLVVMNSAGNSNASRLITVATATVTPVANFTATPKSGVAPLTVTFTDTSTNTPTSWKWSFGDGDPTNSTVQNPIHKYSNAGTYTVSLNATNTAGSNTKIENGYITITVAAVAPVANFTATSRSGVAPLIVTFTDTSTNVPTSWKWSFGDSDPTNSTVQNPIHKYSNAGTYTVSLNATNAAGSNITTKTNYITVTIPPATISATVKIVPNPLNIGVKGYFIAFVTLPKTYNAADVDAKSVICEGAPAVKLVRVKLLPQTFAAVFDREKLVNVKAGDKVQLTVNGTINKNGQIVGLSGSDIIKVTNIKTTVKEPINDVTKMTDDKVFSQFNLK